MPVTFIAPQRRVDDLYLITVFENSRNSRIQHYERSELRLQFE